MGSSRRDGRCNQALTGKRAAIMNIFLGIFIGIVSVFLLFALYAPFIRAGQISQQEDNDDN
jgi:hypothetical protein